MPWPRAIWAIAPLTIAPAAQEGADDPPWKRSGTTP
jgi:hypothetical protein